MKHKAQKFYIETYGCQMNVADSELVVSILQDNGFEQTTDYKQAAMVLVNTCAIRENAEQRVFNRLNLFKSEKKKRPQLKVAILGCMAERLKKKWLETDRMVDIVAGPDAYRSLPQLVETAESGQKAINVQLSRDETYADISPVRTGSNGVSAFVSIMRGCDNMCAFCVVPFTRGRERSRHPKTILGEVEQLIAEGYKEVTLLGQNVDKYNWQDTEGRSTVNFAQLLAQVAQLNPRLRVRFSTSYPHDMTNEVLHTMAAHPNICRQIHLPVQSGSTRILELMKRGYSREWYMNRISAIRRIVPECAISTDVIAGFCTETNDDHQATLSLMQWAQFDFAFMFKYSERPNTYAQRRLEDDVPEPEKNRRLQEIIDLQMKLSNQSNQKDLGKVFEVLIEGESKRSAEKLAGRNSQNKMIVFPRKHYKPGDYVNVKIIDATAATLIGEIVENEEK